MLRVRDVEGVVFIGRMTRKTLGYRLLRWGRIPRPRRSRYESEGVRLLDEGIRVIIAYRHYRAPGKRFVWRRRVGSGSVVLTQKRVAVHLYRWPVLNLELADPRFEKLSVTSPKLNHLRIEVDASDLAENRSGSVTLELRSARAGELLDALRMAA